MRKRTRLIVYTTDVKSLAIGKKSCRKCQIEFEIIQSYKIIPLPLIVTVGIAEASDARALTAPMAAAFFIVACV